MLDQLHGLTFWVEIGIALLAAIYVECMMHKHWKGSKDVPVPAADLREPATSTIAFFGILLPLEVALVAFLYNERPDAHYPSLLVSLLIGLIAVVGALWTSFSLIELAQSADIVTLKPQQYYFIRIRGYMFVSVGLSLAYVMFHLVSEMPPRTPHARTDRAGAVQTDAFLLAKPPLRINQSRVAVVQVWGTATAEDSAHVMEYDGAQSTVRLTFDTANRLEQITESRRQP